MTGHGSFRRGRGWGCQSHKPITLCLFTLILCDLVQQVEGLDLWRSSARIASLFPRTGDLLGGPAESLKKRGENKTVWITNKVYQGETFFDEWDFYNGPDYTHGLVNYLDKTEAMNSGLAYVSADGRANMHVDSTTSFKVDDITNQTRLRPSVRISTKAKYNHGLFILDVAKAPYGCGTWPAYWSTNENWPNDGEIDIIENVHSSVSNQVSWHTTANCTLVSPGNYTGTVGSTICDHGYMSNTGCGIVDPSIASFGAAFNAKGGGIYAMKWDSLSIDVWFFYRTAIPDDILTDLPDPAGWPRPSASLSGLGCPIDNYFRNHMLIFDTTLCGDWAGTSYEAAGCPGTCAERVADPASFVNATWSINYIKIYNQTIINTGYLDAGAIRAGYRVLATGLFLITAIFLLL